VLISHNCSRKYRSHIGCRFESRGRRSLPVSCMNNRPNTYEIRVGQRANNYTLVQANSAWKRKIMGGCNENSKRISPTCYSDDSCGEYNSGVGVQPIAILYNNIAANYKNNLSKPLRSIHGIEIILWFSLLVVMLPTLPSQSWFQMESGWDLNCVNLDGSVTSWLISQGPKAHICTGFHVHTRMHYLTLDTSPWSWCKPCISSYKTVT
jgi:hypothetical protein